MISAVIFLLTPGFANASGFEEIKTPIVVAQQGSPTQTVVGQQSSLVALPTRVSKYEVDAGWLHAQRSRHPGYQVGVRYALGSRMGLDFRLFHFAHEVSKTHDETNKIYTVVGGEGTGGSMGFAFTLAGSSNRFRLIGNWGVMHFLNRVRTGFYDYNDYDGSTPGLDDFPGRHSTWVRDDNKTLLYGGLEATIPFNSAIGMRLFARATSSPRFNHFAGTLFFSL